MPRLQQLHLHVNRITDIRELCRKEFENLEVLDIGNNKIREMPTALVFYLANLTMLAMVNNDVTSMPAWIGFHKRISTLQIDGNPLKQIRRQIVDKGTQEIMRYLRDKFVEGKDDQVEDWAKAQNTPANEYLAEDLQQQQKPQNVDMREEMKMEESKRQPELGKRPQPAHPVPSQMNSAQDAFNMNMQHKLVYETTDCSKQMEQLRMS